MPRALILATLRVLVLLQVAVSSALLYDYTRPIPAFCATASGCEEVSKSSWAHFGSIPTPALGLVCFAALFGLTLIDHSIRKKLVLLASALGAAGALGFIAIQALVLHVFCKLCMIIDTTALLVLALAVLYWFKGDRGSDGSVSRFAWALTCAGAFIGPMAFGSLQPQPPVPTAVAHLWQPGKVNIVELSDFECPFCRMLHPRLSEAAQSFGDQVNFVRVTVPLPMHKHARNASRAYLCAKDQSRGEQMSDALFASEDLSDSSLLELASKQRLQMDAFRKCFEDLATDQRVNGELELARAISFKGLPTLFIGDQKIEGLQETESIRNAIKSQAAGGTQTPPAIPAVWLWAILAIAVLAVMARSLRGCEKQADSA